MITHAEPTTTNAAHVHAALEAMDQAADQPLAIVPAARKTANLDIVRRLKSLLGKAMPGQSGRWNHAHLARALGCNQAYISTYLAQVDAAGHAAANPPALNMSLAAFEDGLEHFLAQIADRKTARDDIFATAISRQFDSFARQCIAARQWGVFHGPGGDGKTCAATAFARRNPLAIMVTAYQWAAGAGPLAAAIFAAVNRAGQWRNTEARIPWLIGRLTGTERVLIVDNFHQLTKAAFTFLGNLHDATGIPIICTGNPSGLARARQDEQIATRIKQAEAATFGQGKALHAAHREAAERILLRDAPDYIADLMPLAVQVLAHKGTMRALQARLALMSAYMDRQGTTDAPAAFRAAHAALISEGFSLE